MRRAIADKNPQLDSYQDVIASRVTFWDELVAGTLPVRLSRAVSQRTEPDSMSLPLHSQWHQGSPYHEQCPVLRPPEEHVMAGCTAVATAQVMYYWQWPVTGTGSATVNYDYRWSWDWDSEPLAFNPHIPMELFTGRLVWTSVDGGQLMMYGYWDETVYARAQAISDDPDFLAALANLYGRLIADAEEYDADFGATTYNWDLLQDVHGLPFDPGDVEVAQLCYHVGVAVGTDYGLWGSSAPLWSLTQRDVIDALEDFFVYDSDATGGNRDIDVMTEEITWLRPVILAGKEPAGEGGGAHVWVVLGYDKSTDPDRLFLVQIGWNTPAMWFACDTLPWSEHQQHAVHIAPAGVVRFVAESGAGDGTPSNPYGDLEEAVAEAPDGATLIFRTGGQYTHAASPLVIERALTLKGRDVTISGQ
jgi:hypothetical protein